MIPLSYSTAYSKRDPNNFTVVHPRQSTILVESVYKNNMDEGWSLLFIGLTGRPGSDWPVPVLVLSFVLSHRALFKAYCDGTKPGG